jgi:hypothetical protein
MKMFAISLQKVLKIFVVFKDLSIFTEWILKEN